MKLVAVVLCGGQGQRLWPLSSHSCPKPFIPLFDSESLLHKTYARVLSLDLLSAVVTVTHEDYKELVTEHFPVGFDAVEHHCIVEPEARDTSAAIATASCYIAKAFGEDVCVLVLPSDHLIPDQDQFNNAVTAAVKAADRDRIVTFGICPDRPATGYGYIKPDHAEARDGVYQVERFVEKPDKESATEYYNSQAYLWNAGLFCFKAGFLLDQMDVYAAELLQQVRSAFSLGLWIRADKAFIPDRELYSDIERISIDYALMEKSDRVAVLPCNFQWSDIGSWDAVAGQKTADNKGNVLEGNVYHKRASGNYVRSSTFNVALIGVDNLIVVDDDNGLLVCNRDSVEDVKSAAGELVQMHTDKPDGVVNRAWGTYQVIEQGVGYKVKRIAVNPGASLSLQKHRYRSEHWVVVSGLADVVHEGREFQLNVNESAYIPAGDLHKLSNAAGDVLVIIEVQSGSYLEEDDIERFD